MSRWDYPVDGGACEAGSPPCWGPIQELVGSVIAEGEVNRSGVFDPIANDLDPNLYPGLDLDPNLAAMTFGEAAINLTLAEVFDNDTDDCIVFGSVYLKSRSSDSFTASMKDFIAPVSISVSNCATLTIVKDSVPDDAQAFSFSIDKYVDLDFGPETPLMLDDDENSPLLNSRTFEVHENDLNNSYLITENDPGPEWDLTGLECSPGGVGDPGSATAEVNLTVGQNVTCTFTNTKRGHIIVVQETIGGDASFGFTLNGGPGPIAEQAFSLTGAAQEDSGALRPGTYAVVTEDPGTEWDLNSATCDDGSPVDRIDLNPGETVTCTLPIPSGVTSW